MFDEPDDQPTYCDPGNSRLAVRAASRRRCFAGDHPTHHASTVNAGVVLGVHDPADCQGRPCALHNSSEHHMANWPQRYRFDKGFMERVCPHGIGHTDPDDVAYFAGINAAGWTLHGCDGCCRQDTP